MVSKSRAADFIHGAQKGLLALDPRPRASGWPPAAQSSAYGAPPADHTVIIHIFMEPALSLSRTCTHTFGCIMYNDTKVVERRP